MRHWPMVMYATTLVCAFTSGFAQMRAQEQMKDFLDFGSIGATGLSGIFRNVVRDYEQLNPDDELARKYWRYSKLTMLLMSLFLLEIVAMQHIHT